MTPHKPTLASLMFFKSVSDMIDRETKEFSFMFISHIDKAIKERGMNKAELAKEIGCSKSYLTQLWRGDKVVNLTFLAKCQYVLELRFIINSEIE